MIACHAHQEVQMTRKAQEFAFSVEEVPQTMLREINVSALVLSEHGRTAQTVVSARKATSTQSSLWIARHLQRILTASQM